MEAKTLRVNKRVRIRDIDRQPGELLALPPQEITALVAAHPDAVEAVAETKAAIRRVQRAARVLGPPEPKPAPQPPAVAASAEQVDQLWENRASVASTPPVQPVDSSEQGKGRRGNRSTAEDVTVKTKP